MIRAITFCINVFFGIGPIFQKIRNLFCMLPQFLNDPNNFSSFLDETWTRNTIRTNNYVGPDQKMPWLKRLLQFIGPQWDIFLSAYIYVHNRLKINAIYIEFVVLHKQNRRQMAEFTCSTYGQLESYGRLIRKFHDKFILHFLPNYSKKWRKTHHGNLRMSCP